MNKIIIVMSLVMMLFLASCSSGSDANTNAFPSIGSNSGTSGGVGVSLEFAENNPPGEMIKDQPYNFAFVWRNYQEHEVNDLQVKASGFDSGYISGLESLLNSGTSVGTLPRYTSQTGPGIYTGQVLNGVQAQGFQNSYPFNPTFSWCYSTTSTYQEQICVPSTLNTCELKVDTTTAKNGPVSFTIDRISSIGSELRIDLKAQNIGPGKIVSECFEKDTYSVEFSTPQVTLGSTSGNCEAVSGFNFVNGEAYFYCTFSRVSDDAYASQLVISLDGVNYQQELTKPITAVDLNAQ